MATKNRISIGLTLLVAFSIILSACQPAPQPTAAPANPTALPNTGGNNSGQAVNLMVKDDMNLGNILADAKGMTLYVFLKDTANTSNCYDKCATNWPPLIAAQGASITASGSNAKFGTTTRKDGSLQVTVNGMPVYNFIKDKTSADVFGQGVGGVWYVLDPDGNVNKTALPATQAAPAGGTTAPTNAAPAAAATQAPAAGTPGLMLSDNSKLGKILTDSKGMTLYVFTVDKPNTSNCTDKCAQTWPPFLVDKNAMLTAPVGFTGKLGTITRQDGSTQLTVNEMPVYYFFKDTKAGDTNGQDVGSVWFVVDATGNMVKQ